MTHNSSLANANKGFETMNNYSQSPDDKPPENVSQLDKMMQVELERSIARCVYEECDRITQALLSNCQWYVTNQASVLKLIIDCPDVVSYWHIVSNIPQIGSRLERFSKNAKIRVYPPSGKGMPFEISISEITAYRDWI
ncbi:hypothetical protein DSM106972_024270 [Dulcicalothrix desertica PCC 7102]|jgi:hypothetical protein|uniref:Uncharacterized protein n=2 Tax=Dulcicalothrix desertica TaxID=32056 RepID=A0A433VM39_9CYAN|nr:hypothetical protein DSM106972_024270 [Dulcicalothrix desertica PCC 7102]TWH61839.1 hypothetical protein CAL7102_00516 [Dulcicalothrix desertica PCC 7102]